MFWITKKIKQSKWEKNRKKYWWWKYHVRQAIDQWKVKIQIGVDIDNGKDINSSADESNFPKLFSQWGDIGHLDEKKPSTAFLLNATNHFFDKGSE